MSEKDINKKAFDEGTLLKIKIFQECFREWFPVFLYTPGIERICIYDLFAGSGYDTEGNPVWWYRGQANAKWPVLPGVLREDFIQSIYFQLPVFFMAMSILRSRFIMKGCCCQTLSERAVA